MITLHRLYNYLFHSLAGWLILSGLLIPGLMLPFIVVDKLYFVEKGNQDLFLDHSRFTARLLADITEIHSVDEKESNIISILDGAILSGRIVFAEIKLSDRTIKSSVADSINALPFKGDLKFGEHQDNVYFISLPITIGKEQISGYLRLGFDEKQTQEMIYNSYLNSLTLFSLYALIIPLVVIIYGKRLLYPINNLRRASRKVASGKFDEHLQVQSTFTEIQDLAADLEEMRRELVVQALAVSQANQVMKEQQEKIIDSKTMVAIGQMAATVAHSIRNPLASISTSAELAMEISSNAEVQEIAEDITFEVKRVDQWIREFLLFSHPHEVERENIVELLILLQQVIDGFTRILEKNGIACEIATEGSSLLMYGDAALLKQMFNSLISNAIEAMPEGGKIICRIKKVENNIIELSICDNGKGIDEHLFANIFKPFFTSKPNGVGIGLTQVKRIVEDHFGSIDIASEKNHGTTITLCFPAISTNKPRILVIEDELKLARNIQTYLQKFKYDVCIANTGHDGLIELKHFNPEIILLDFQLPDINGLEVLNSIMKIDNQIKVILMTGHGNFQRLGDGSWKDVQKEAERNGIYAFLLKPFSLAEVRTVIEKTSFVSSK